MLSYELGPGDVFVWLRERLGIEHDEKGAPDAWPDSFPAKLVKCPWCLGVWVAPLVYGVYLVAPFLVVLTAAMTILVVVETTIRR